MTILMVHVKDDWTEFPNDEIKLFEDSDVGLKKAIDFAEFSIPWDEDHMNRYFKTCSNKIGEESRNKIIDSLSKADYANDGTCVERFPARFQFSITREHVEG